jgi:hypothetical protein
MANFFKRLFKKEETIQEKVARLEALKDGIDQRRAMTRNNPPAQAPGPEDAPPANNDPPAQRRWLSGPDRNV